jgi:hypothetical protein
MCSTRTLTYSDTDCARRPHPLPPHSPTPARYHLSEIRGLQDAARRTALYQEFITNARRVPVKAGSLLLWNSRYRFPIIT